MRPKYLNQLPKSKQKIVSDLIDRHVSLRLQEIKVLETLIKKMKRENQLYMEVQKSRLPLQQISRLLANHDKEKQQ